ncbi:MAG: hypothetical protein GC181_12080 [Bacteroidetes bacterium]|nr:hypothetical protein [Bacteroidota bacterium]
MVETKWIKLLVCLVFLSISNSLSAQTRSPFRKSLYEVKFGAGCSMFLGDLGGGSKSGSWGLGDLNLRSVRHNTSVGLKLNLSNAFSLRLDVFNARLYANDAYSKDRSRHNRNLSFRTNLTEVSTTVEFFSIHMNSNRINSRTGSEFYTFAGFGLIFFNPQAEYNGLWYNLQPLGTEGEGIVPGYDPYKLRSKVIPFGFGYRVNVVSSTYIGIEFSLRKTFTDYIDDVSGKYVDKELIRESHGDIAATLSDRTLTGSAVPGTNRGSNATNDNYSFVQLTIARGFGDRLARHHLFIVRSIGGVRVVCPKFK